MWFAYITKRMSPKRLFYKSESMPFNLSVASMDPRWKHPFPALVAGPTCCGKSQFVKRLLESGEDMIEGAPRDSSEINHLAKQMFPGHVKYMQESFQDATIRSYGYLLCDLKSETPTVFRLRTNVFPGGTQFAYVRKVYKD